MKTCKNSDYAYVFDFKNLNNYFFLTKEEAEADLEDVCEE